MTYLKPLCRLIAACAVTGIVLNAGVILLGFLVDGGAMAQPSWVTTSGPSPAPGIGLGYRLVGDALESLPNLVMIFVFLSLFRLMLLCAKGEVFSAAALRLINLIALGLLGGEIVKLVTDPFVYLVFSWPLGAGHRILEVSLGSKDGIALFQGFVAVVIALVMAEARRIADEHARFV